MGNNILIISKIARKLKGKRIKSKSKKFRIKKYSVLRLFRNCYPEYSDLGRSDISTAKDNNINIGITFKYRVPVAPEKITLNFQISDSDKDNKNEG